MGDGKTKLFSYQGTEILVLHALGEIYRVGVLSILPIGNLMIWGGLGSPRLVSTSGCRDRVAQSFLRPGDRDPKILPLP